MILKDVDRKLESILCSIKRIVSSALYDNLSRLVENAKSCGSDVRGNV